MSKDSEEFLPEKSSKASTAPTPEPTEPNPQEQAAPTNSAPSASVEPEVPGRDAPSVRDAQTKKSSNGIKKKGGFTNFLLKLGTARFSSKSDDKKSDSENEEQSLGELIQQLLKALMDAFSKLTSAAKTGLAKSLDGLSKRLPKDSVANKNIKNLVNALKNKKSRKIDPEKLNSLSNSDRTQMDSILQTMGTGPPSPIQNTPSPSSPASTPAARPVMPTGEASITNPNTQPASSPMANPLYGQPYTFEMPSGSSEARYLSKSYGNFSEGTSDLGLSGKSCAYIGGPFDNSDYNTQLAQANELRDKILKDHPGLDEKNVGIENYRDLVANSGMERFGDDPDLGSYLVTVNNDGLKNYLQGNTADNLKDNLLSGDPSRFTDRYQKEGQPEYLTSPRLTREAAQKLAKELGAGQAGYQGATFSGEFNSNTNSPVRIGTSSVDGLVRVSITKEYAEHLRANPLALEKTPGPSTMPRPEAGQVPTGVPSSKPESVHSASASATPPAVNGVVCIDFDNTMVNGHFHAALKKAGVPEGQAKPEDINRLLDDPEKGPKNAEAMRDTIRSALNNNQGVAITSFTKYPEVVEPTLKRIGLTSEEIGKIHIVGGFPSEGGDGKPTMQGGNSRSEDRKEQHIQSAMDHFHVTDPKSVLLIDDSAENVAHARDKDRGNHSAILVPDHPNADPSYLTEAQQWINEQSQKSQNRLQSPSPEPRSENRNREDNLGNEGNGYTDLGAAFSNVTNALGEGDKELHTLMGRDPKQDDPLNVGKQFTPTSDLQQENVRAEAPKAWMKDTKPTPPEPSSDKKKEEERGGMRM